MPKKDFLISQFKGQIDDWDDQIYKLTCDIKETADENVKIQCRKTIEDLGSKRSKAMDEIEKLEMQE
jgi:hypothetical protein